MMTDSNLYTVQEFCEYVNEDLNAFIAQVANIGRNVSDEEKKAYAGSYPVVAKMLSKAMAKNPGLADAHISSSQLLLEYKLPAASAWCDLVLLGDNKDGNHQVIIIELKNYLKNSIDEPASFVGAMMHNGELIKHPADQVKGYTEYCRRFHSAVKDSTKVDGCVYFTQPINLEPYQMAPNDSLTVDYLLFNSNTTDELSDFVTERIEKGNKKFAAEFINGYYQQDRSILNQVAKQLQAASDSVRPFVLLDEQRLGFHTVMDILKKRVEDGKKEVIIVQGPPGSGKSAVAVNLWIEAALKYSQTDKGNVVFVTTSGSQKDNWNSLFDTYGQIYHASDLIVTANSFNPGMSGGKMKETLLPAMRAIDEKYVSERSENSLKFEYYEDYLNYMIANQMTRNYKPNLHFLSIVDEAHALIDPTAHNFCSNKTAGWCFQMGPQAYHIINESQVSVFFTDDKQSFRDNESTSIDTIKALAKKLNANVTEISLAGMQFRCAGSTDYVEWVENLFTEHPVNNVSKWEDKFKINIVDYPSDLESILRGQIARGNKSCRILSTYTRKWVSPSELNETHSGSADFDFILEDRGDQMWKKYWNNPNGYGIFVQGTPGSKMEIDPLCEVGCPYVVRGFDYDHIGLLWLDDIIRRDNHWVLSLKNVQETATGSTKAKAIQEQKDAIRKKIIKKKMGEIDIVPAFDSQFPAATALFNTVVQAYRILMTRGIKSLTIYIKDKETRDYVKSLLNQL